MQDTTVLDSIRTYAKEHKIDPCWVLVCFYWRGDSRERRRITLELKQQG